MWDSRVKENEARRHAQLAPLAGGAPLGGGRGAALHMLLHQESQLRQSEIHQTGVWLDAIPHKGGKELKVVEGR